MADLTLSGAMLGQLTSDGSPISPFADVSLTAPSGSPYATLTVGLSSSANGSLSNLGIGTLSADGASYTVRGSTADVQAAVRGLVFTPVVHEVPVGQSVTTGFTLTASDTAGAVTDARTSVVATAADTLPTLTDTSAMQPASSTRTGSGLSFNPFAYTTIGDPDAGASETTTITLTSGGAASDAIGLLSGPGLTKTGVGAYTLATASPAAESSALEALAFTPVSATSAALIGVTLTVSDGVGSPTSATSTLRLLQGGGINGVSTTTSTQFFTIYNDTVSSQATHTYATTIDAVLNGGSVVYDQTFNLPYSDPQVQAAVAAARTALINAGAAPGAAVLSASNTSIPTSQTTAMVTGQSTTVAVSSANVRLGPDIIGPNLHLSSGGATTDGSLPSGYLGITAGQISTDIPEQSTTTVSRTVTTTYTDLLSQQYVISGTSTVMPTTTLVSSSAAGVEGNAGSQTSNTAVAFTADGTSVLFNSTATNLAPGAADGMSELYLKNTATGAITLVTTNTAGALPNGGVTYGSVDGDGNLVAFFTSSTNLDARATDGSEHVFVRNVSAATLTLISPTDYVITNAVTGAVAPSTNFSNLESPSISGDGRYIAAAASAPNGQLTILLLDTLAHTGVELNTAANNFVTAPAVSRDGSTVVFSTGAMLQPAGTQPTDADAKADIYAYTIASNTFQLVSDTQGANAPSVKSNGYSAYPSVSSDGLHIAFASYATNFDSRDTTVDFDIYVKDVATGRLVLADTTADGTKANGDSYAPSISADGTLVAFDSTATNLVAGVTDGALHAYVKNLTSGALSLLDHTSTGAPGNGVAQNPILSPDGAHAAFFSTASNVVANDTNGAADVFLTAVPAAAAAPPSISGIQQISTGPAASPILLQPNVVITDDTPGQFFRVDIDLSNRLSGSISGGGFTQSQQLGDYAVVALSVAEAQADLRAAVFNATGGQAESVTYTITFSEDDAVVATAGGSQLIIATAAAPTNTAPVIGGTAANQPTTDKSTLQPFATATVTDPDAAQTETVTVTYTAGNGTLAGGGFTGSTGSYSASFASAAAAQAGLQALVFTPTANEVAPGSAVTTGFTVAVNDGQATATNTGASVVATSVNDPPTLGAIPTSQAATAGAASTPFAAATIADPDTGQTETVTVSFAAGSGAFAGVGFSGSGGVYSGAFASAAAAQAALRAATFTPTAGMAASDTLTVSVQDAPGGGAPATASTTLAVGFTPTNTAPMLSGTQAGQADVAGVAISPFAGVTVTDPDAGQTETVTVSFAAANGVLSGGGFTLTGTSGGVSTYSVTAPAGAAGASAAATQADLRAAVFTPTAGQSATTSFTVTVSDGQQTATNAATSVVATYTPPASGGGGGTGVVVTGPPSTNPLSAQYGLTVEFQNLERALAGGVDALTLGTPVAVAFQAEKVVAAQLDSGQLTLAQAEAALAHLVDGTTAVAVASYGFFTGSTPTAAGLNYLVHSPANATDLNDAYYAKFSTENRYINFAVNLATGPGAGASAFQATYGSLSLSDAVAKAYAAVFGTPADAAKVSALLDTLVPDGLGGQETRAQYFAQYGGDGPNGQGTKAAAIGFLLSSAVHEGSGVYGAATEHYLAALAHGFAPAFGSELALTYGANVNLVGFTPTPDASITG